MPAGPYLSGKVSEFIIHQLPNIEARTDIEFSRPSCGTWPRIWSDLCAQPGRDIPVLSQEAGSCNVHCRCRVLPWRHNSSHHAEQPVCESGIQQRCQGKRRHEHRFATDRVLPFANKAAPACDGSTVLEISQEILKRLAICLQCPWVIIVVPNVT
jgi:hypothetical protein